jgi:hypothetical protein
MSEALNQNASKSLHPANAFQSLQDLSRQEEAHLASLEKIRIDRAKLPAMVRRSLGALPLTDTENLLKAAVVLGPVLKTPSAIVEKLAQLQTLNDRIENGRNDVALWVNSGWEEYQVVSHGDFQTRATAQIAIGRLDPSASIEVNQDGELSVPLVSGFQVDTDWTLAQLGDSDPKNILSELAIYGATPEAITTMRIEAIGGLGGFVLAIGDEAIDAVLETARPSAQRGVDLMREQLSATLF